MSSRKEFIVIFFVNKAIGHGNSGVEHAQFYRADIFRQAHQPFKMIYSDLLPKLHEHAAEWHLQESEVIGLYDYFLSDDPDDYLRNGLREVSEYHEEVLWDQTHTQRRFDRQTTGGYLETIQRVKRYSDERKLYLVDDDRVILTNGNHKIMWHYRDSGSRKKQAVSIRLFNFKGRDYFFQTYEALVMFFYEQLNQTYPNSLYIIDRGQEHEEALIHLKRHGAGVKLLDVVHAAHLAQFEGAHPLWNNYYQYMFDHFDDMSAVINATEVQTQAMKADLSRVGQKQLDKITTIPVGGVETVMPARHWSGKEARFVTASRLHPEKHITQIVSAIKLLRDQGLNATLTIYGDGGDIPHIKKSISELKLQKFVTLAGLSQHVIDDLKQYDAFVSASYSEGFGLTYIEAISDALPIATYANFFGAQELVKEGLNGHLATFERHQDATEKNVVQLSQAMAAVFQSTAHYADLSRGAEAVAKKYQTQEIAKKWSALIRRVNHES